MRDDGSSGFLPGFMDSALARPVLASPVLESPAFERLASSEVFHPGSRRGATQRDVSLSDLTHSAPVPTKKASPGSPRALNTAVFGDATCVNPSRNKVAVPNAQQRFGLHQGDAVEWLRALPSDSVNLLITDPPYESLEKHRAIGTTTRLKHSKASSNDWFQIFPNSRFAELFSEVYRVLARNSHFYLFCDPETMFVAKPIAEQCGFRFWKPLVWDKQKIGMGYHYRARYEFVLFFEKGKRKLNDLGIPDVIECARIRNGYPTEKPAYVSEVLIRQSSQVGELVVDPFMGSASVGEAALRLERRFMGCDVSENALALSHARLSAIATP